MAEPINAETAGGSAEGHEPGAGTPIVMITPTWSRHGGIAAHVLSSAAALAAQGNAVEVVVRRIETAERPPGVTVHEAPRLLERGADATTRLGPAAALEATVAHLHQVEDLDLLRALQSRAPVVLSVHGYLACTADEYYFQPGRECTRSHGPMCVPNLAFKGCAHTRDPRPLPGAYRRTSREVRAMEISDLTICYSSAVDRHLRNNRIEPRRIVPLFATVEPSPERAPVENRVLFAGRIVPSKGLATLIEAVRAIDCELVVCGDGWQLEEMRGLARRLGVAGRVHFRGWLEPADLAAELSAAAVLAIPSIWPEPFGLVGLEALAARRPVVGSATGGLADWLTDGVSGLLCPPGDARALAARISELLADPVRRAAMGEAGARDVAERFSPARHTEALLDAYRQAREAWSARAAAA